MSVKNKVEIGCAAIFNFKSVQEVKNTYHGHSQKRREEWLHSCEIGGMTTICILHLY